MDPNIALFELMAAIATGDYCTAEDRLLGLMVWHNRGGFPPSNIRVNDDGSIAISKETSNAIRS